MQSEAYRGQLDGTIKRGADHDQVPIDIPSLAARYHHYEVEDTVQSLVFEFEVDPQEALDVDALVKIDDTWKRIRSEGNRRLEFCRVDPEERVDEIVLVLSNHARTRAAIGGPAQLSGDYFITARDSCAEWSGSFRYVYTDDEVSSYTDASGTFTTDDHFRSEGNWSIVGVHPAAPGDKFDSVDTIWTGTVSLTKDEESHYTRCADGDYIGLTSTLSGTETGPQGFRIDPWDTDPDQLTVGLAEPFSGGIPVTGSHTGLYCGGSSLTTPIDTTWIDLQADAMVNGLPILVPDPDHPGRYVGRQTVDHVEQPRPGGSKVTDSYVEWDLFRRPR